MTEVFAPMVGKVVSVDVKVGDHVKKNEAVATIEAMKMLVKIFAPSDGEVKEIKISEDAIVNTSEAIMVLK
ncbi:MAG TPA: biotin/lipoyl-containing protein [Clostridia bacterium]|nr:biotin/lipoyl-containing protein [Clostridia bacterium]